MNTYRVCDITFPKEGDKYVFYMDGEKKLFDYPDDCTFTSEKKLSHEEAEARVEGNTYERIKGKFTDLRDGDLIEFSFGENGEMRGVYTYDSRFDYNEPHKLSCRWIIVDQGAYEG